VLLPPNRIKWFRHFVAYIIFIEPFVLSCFVLDYISSIELLFC
jgi:hypothetical protein